jgi:hypothetical protein
MNWLKLKYPGLIIATVVAAYTLLIFNSCKKENLCDCIKRTGEETSVSRALPGFDRITVEDKIEVFLLEGPEFHVRIEGGKNVIKLIKTTVENGMLTVKNDNKCNFTRSYKKKIKVYVTAPRYAEIIHNGVGNIFCPEPLKSDSFVYHVVNSGDLHLNVDNTFFKGGNNGMGDIYAKGKTNMHNVYTNGEGWVNCQNLQTERTHMVIKTSGRSYINATVEVAALIERDGDVFYNGDPPTVTRTGNGKGKLIKGY